MSPAILGFKNSSHHNSNNNSHNASKDPSMQTTISTKLWQNKGKNAEPSVQELPTPTPEPTSQPHLSRQDLSAHDTLAEKNMTVELRITPPFPALRLSSFSSPLRASNPNSRVSRFSRNHQSSSEGTNTPVLAPSPIITRTSHGDDLLSTAALCNGEYWSEYMGEEKTPITRPSPVRTLWTKRSSELISVPKEALGPVSTAPRITISAFLQTNNVMNDTAYQRPAMQSASSSQNSINTDAKSRTVSDSIVNFARRSWNSPAPSRSSSPSSRDDGSKDGDSSSTTASSTPSLSPTDKNSIIDGPATSKPSLASRRNSISSVAAKKPRRPFSLMFSKSASSEPVVPSIGSIRSAQSASTDNLTAVSKSLGKRTKDELWEPFRALESDYTK